MQNRNKNEERNAVDFNSDQSGVIYSGSSTEDEHRDEARLIAEQTTEYGTLREYILTELKACAHIKLV